MSTPATPVFLKLLADRQGRPGGLLFCGGGAAALLAPGTNWVEGDWPLQAPACSSSAQAASRATALQLVQLVANEAHTHEIEEVLRREQTLSYQLLKLVNSLAMGAGHKVTSFSQAILILGRQQLRRWLNLMLFAARSDDVRSPEATLWMLEVSGEMDRHG
jgi:hypothetical protein